MCISIIYCVHALYTVLKIDVTVEESAGAIGRFEDDTKSFEDIMIKVQVSEGQLLPGKRFPIMLRGSFPNGMRLQN